MWFFNEAYCSKVINEAQVVHKTAFGNILILREMKPNANFAQYMLLV